MDERIRVQSLLYPWVLLSVLNGRHASIVSHSRNKKVFPSCCVRVMCKEAKSSVCWSPDLGTVTFEPYEQAYQSKGGIGLKFASCAHSVGFFENTRLVGLSFKGGGRVVQWKRFIAQLMAIQGDLGSKKWSSMSDQVLLEKTKYTLYSAIVGLNGLGELDSFSGDLLKHVPNGCIRIRMGGVEGVVGFVIVKDGRVYWELEQPSDVGRSVDFTFKDIRSAWMSVANLSDNLTAVGKGDIMLRGYIPLADGFNHMLDRLQMFVKAG